MILLLIHRMSATFGKLQGQILELKDGLNILQAPNEAGKSTWCAFLVSMFYGINSRERDKAGFIADKNRYAPWSGTAMSGRMDCRAGTDELTLTRTTRRQSAPMGEFSAVYAGTGNAVSELTGPACGETLLGVSREVFERSAFIRQAGLTISQDAGLERRIAALITSGEEETSYTEAADALKKQLNRRRHNKTGQLPELERELQETRRQLEGLEDLEHQLTEARAQASSLAEQESALAAELARHDLWDAAQQRLALSEAEETASRAEETAAVLRHQMEDERIPGNDTIGRLRGAIVNLETVRKAVEKARTERDETMKAVLRAETAVGKSPFAGQTPEGARKSAGPGIPSIRRPAWWIPALLAIVGAAFTAFLLRGRYPIYGAAISGLCCAVPGLIAILRSTAADREKRAAYLAAYGVDTPEALAALADAYTQLCQTLDTVRAEADKRSAAADSLYNSLTSNEQGILLEVRRFAPAAYDIPTADQLLRQCAVRRRELLNAESAAREARMRFEVLSQQSPVQAGGAEAPTPPARSREAVTLDLESTRATLSAARSAADRLAGQLHAMGDPVVLRSSAGHLERQINDLEGEYNAIRLAMDVLEDSNTTLQNRFSPALGRRAAEIFSELTEGRYIGVVLDRSFHLSAEPAESSVYRDAQLLSAGAADQLYLAVRLAICDLVLPEDKAVPIILDDALANFDDARCAAALRWLKAEAKHRQILLFTCHSREANFFAGDVEVSVQRLSL